MTSRRALRAARRYAWLWLALLPGAPFVHAAFVTHAPAARTSSQVGASGGELIAQHRCGACHLDLPRADATRPLSALSARTVYALLRDRARHPDFHLSAGEAVAIAVAVAPASARELSRERRQSPGATAEVGIAMVRGLRCGACHAGLPLDDTPAPVLARTVAGSNPEWLRSFLSAPHAIRPYGTRPGNGARMPAFGLSQQEADSIAAFLQRRAVLAPAAQQVAPLSIHASGVADALLDRLSCRGCHVYRGRGGRVGPELDGVRTRRTAAYIAAISRDPAATHPGAAMPRVQDARLERVIALLAAGDARHAQAGRADAQYLSPLEHALVPLAGDAVYARWCAACHGPSGRGDGYNARFLDSAPAVHADAALMSIRPDDTLFDGIAGGGAVLGRSPEMPPFGGTLNNQDIAQLVMRLRELCRCAAPLWSRDGRR
jgi:mono/diheme cytochrome c family protein